MEKGTVFKMMKTHGFIKPDSWKNTRKDILFDPRLHNLKIGDRVEYTSYEDNNRKYVLEVKKIEKKVRIYG